MKATRRNRRPSGERPTPANLTYYIVVLISGLMGLVAYNSGATLEGTIIRMGLVLLACTVLGYATNVILWLSASNQQPMVAGTAGKASRNATGSRVDLVAGDDEILNEPNNPAGASPS